MPTLSEPPRTRSAEKRKSILSENEEVRSIQAGLLLAIVFWPLIVWVLGIALQTLSHDSKYDPSTAAKPSFDIQLVPEEFSVPEPPPPDKFVETNPDAPENTPDKTRNFAARNQQVAQEKPTPDGKSDTPELEGKKDQEVTQIVSGQLNQPQELQPPAPPPIPEVPPSAAQAAARKEQNPLPGYENIQGENKEGVGSSASEFTNNVSDVRERVEGEKEERFPVALAQPGQPRIDPQRPQPRRRVERNVRPAVLAENRVGTSNIGLTAIDARWSQYGEYLQRLVETVQVQWERILEETRTYPPPGSTVTVRFRLDAKEGAVVEILHSESTGGTQAERVCQRAITERSPYGKWSEDMVAVLGQHQDLTFTFHYQ